VSGVRAGYPLQFRAGLSPTRAGIFTVIPDAFPIDKNTWPSRRIPQRCQSSSIRFYLPAVKKKLNDPLAIAISPFIHFSLYFPILI
jgi:hypothetical protein